MVETRNENAPIESIWAEIKIFQHVEYVAEKIIQKHNLKKEHFANAKKQAYQIRSCLQQARDYSIAASNAGSSTKPMQTYYSIMSIAFAEILYRGTGDLSLNKLREKHRGHGLQLIFDNSFDGIFPNHSVKILERGTYGAWLNVGVPDPIIGPFSYIEDNTTATGYGVILSSDTLNRDILSQGSISISEVFQHDVFIEGKLKPFGAKTKTVRVMVSHKDEISIANGKRRYFNIAIQPSRSELYEELINDISISPNLFEDMVTIDIDNGVIIKILSPFREGASIRMPNGSNRNKENFYICVGKTYTNCFGNQFLGSYILGMLCRYYPEYWQKELENHTSLSTISDIFLSNALIYSPLHILSVLDDNIYTFD